MSEFVILHRGSCSCVSGGYVPEGFYDRECGKCDEPFGFNVPVVMGEGRLTVHMSCAIEVEITESRN